MVPDGMLPDGMLPDGMVPEGRTPAAPGRLGVSSGRLAVPFPVRAGLVAMNGPDRAARFSGKPGSAAPFRQRPELAGRVPE
jgi:hypothetical protein